MNVLANPAKPWESRREKLIYVEVRSWRIEVATVGPRGLESLRDNNHE
jgi:hypothetical protein